MLASDLLATPAYCRVSRMIRDIPANDILTGNKKINLRQMVEQEGGSPRRRRGMPCAGDTASRDQRRPGADTDSGSAWTRSPIPDDRRRMFLHMGDARGAHRGVCGSLPYAEAVARAGRGGAGGDASPFPCAPGEIDPRGACVRPGRRPASHERRAQHRGLGRAGGRACAIAHERSSRAVNVISAVGTRGYYRNLGRGQRPLPAAPTLTDHRPVIQT